MPSVDRWSALIIIVGLLYFASVLLDRTARTSRPPVAGRRSVFEPNWLLRLRFIRDSRNIIRQGYESYADAFTILRSTGDVVLIRNHGLIEEIRAHTNDSNRSVQAFLDDFCSEYTRGQVFVESDLQNRVLQQKVTPNLSTLVLQMRDELRFVLDKELPMCDDNAWVELNIVDVFARIVARISARVLIGPEGCRNEEWLATTEEYTRNVFITGFILRFVPRWLRPVVAPMLPTYRCLLRNIATARRIIGNLVEDRSQNGKTHHDVLQWTMELANEKELELDNLAQRMLILSLSAIHTTALTIAQAVFDLCAHPDHLSEIRDETTDVLRSHALIDKDGLQRLVKLDSLLKESQRLNPVFLLTFQRILPSAVTLSNGTHLPKGTRIAVPQNAILQDPRLVPGSSPPEVYDPWRYVRLREKPQNSRSYQFSMTDSVHMAFGYGKYACPGRFFVANEIKLVLAYLLQNFDWKLPKGCQRPKNYTIDADMYPDISARVCFKRRTMSHEAEHLVEI